MMSPCMLVFASICLWQILPFHLASVDASIPADLTILSDDDIQLQLNYITRRLYILEEEDAHLNKRLSGIEEENEALKAGNAHLNKRLSSIEDENVALKAENADLNKRLTSIEEENILIKTEDARLDKRLSSIEDDNHELMKNVKFIKELSNTLKEKTNTVVPVNNGLKHITSTLTYNHKYRGQKRLLVPAGSSNIVPSPVAFTAVLTHNEELGPLQTLEYDKVITNIGNAYDSRHGHFTAPVKGIYMLSATVFDNYESIRTEMVKNGVQLVAMFGDDYDSASHTIIVSLEQNDMVWVRHFKEGTSTVHAGSDRYYTSFSGALIAALQ